MAQCTTTFEAGVDGNTIATGEGNTPYDLAGKGASGTFTYSSTQKYGTLSAKVTTGTGAFQIIRWSTALGTLTDQYGRAYLFVPSLPGSAQAIIMDSANGGNPRWGFVLNSDGKITLRNGTALGSTQASATVAISTNQWVRLEFRVISSATVGQMEIKLFNSPDSAVVTETVATTANLNTGANSTSIDFGANILNATAFTFYMDNIVAGATSYPGPYVAAASTHKSTSVYNPRVRPHSGRRGSSRSR